MLARRGTSTATSPPSISGRTRPASGAARSARSGTTLDAFAPSRSDRHGLRPTPEHQHALHRGVIARRASSSCRARRSGGISTDPPERLERRAHRVHPDPRPEISEHRAAVERPSNRTRARRKPARGRKSAARSRCTTPASTARSRTASRSIPAPSSLTESRIVSFSRRRLDRDVPPRFPGRCALGRLDPVIRRVAHRCTSGSESDRGSSEFRALSSAPAKLQHLDAPRPSASRDRSRARARAKAARGCASQRSWCAARARAAAARRRTRIQCGVRPFRRARSI
jgi:hypothetical protein